MSEEVVEVKFYSVEGYKAAFPAGTYLMLTAKQAAVRNVEPVEGEEGLYEALGPVEFKQGEVIGLVDKPAKTAPLVPAKAPAKEPKAAKAPKEAPKAAKAPKAEKKPEGPTDDEQKATMEAILAIPEAERTEEQVATLAALQDGK